MVIADTSDIRLGDLFGNNGAVARIAIVGFPCDEGVVRNGGRPGAAAAPRSVRRYLRKLTPDARDAAAFVAVAEMVVDSGDVSVSDGLEESQAELGREIGQVLGRGQIPIIIGGGHETSFGHFLGYVEAGRKVSVLNIDAHPDVRPGQHATSGTPFRQMIEHDSGTCSGYAVAGLSAHSVAEGHVSYLRSAGARCLWAQEYDVDEVARWMWSEEGDVMVSMDIDAVDAAFAPGVSAPTSSGLDRRIWLRTAFEAGACPRVTSFDVVEVNPGIDVDDRTSRLAALTIWFFLSGLVARFRNAAQK